MVAQGVLGFQYEPDSSDTGLTSLGGLPLYFDLIHAIGLDAAIRRELRVAGRQGWLDIQMVLAVIFLNLAGGDCVEDIERLEADTGFTAILGAIEKDLLSRAERRSLKARWRRARTYGALALGAVRLAGAVPRSGRAKSRRGQRVHSGADGTTPGSVAREPGATGVHANASAIGLGDFGHGRDAD